jgi:hypothetical protein
VAECIILAANREPEQESIYLLIRGDFDRAYGDDEKLIEQLMTLLPNERKARLFLACAQNFRAAYYHLPTGEMKGDFFDIIRLLPEDVQEELLEGWNGQQFRNRQYLRSTHQADQFQEPRPDQLNRPNYSPFSRHGW